MHFTTRCSACDTLFWIGSDQLQVSDGWVRCGNCGAVFDATLSLQAPPGAPEAQDPASASSPPPVTATPAMVPAPEPVPAAVPAPAPEPVAIPEPEPTAPPEPATPADPQPEAAAPAPAPERLLSPMGYMLESGRGATQRLDQQPVAPEPPPIPDDPTEPSFVRQARRRAFWRSPGVRAGLVLLSLLLSLLLAGQWVYHHRDRLAASVPALRPGLAQACEWLSCQLSPVRRLDTILIDSTTLVHRLDNFYAFDIVLKNTATIPLAMPALELTLTRADDSVLARRVFLPHELPGASLVLPARESVPISLRLALVTGEGSPMAGYRALVFYP